MYNNFNARQYVIENCSSWPHGIFENARETIQNDPHLTSEQKQEALQELVQQAQAAKKRKEIAKQLTYGSPVEVMGNSNSMKTSENAQSTIGSKLKIDNTRDETLSMEKGVLATDDVVAKKRKEIAERLMYGIPVEIVGNSGEMKTSEDDQSITGPKIKVYSYREDWSLFKEGGCLAGPEPKIDNAGDESLFIEKGALAVDDAAAKKRKEIAERLKRGEDVEIVGNNGEMTTSEDAQNPASPRLKVVEGKLAAAFYWYEKDRELFEAEVEAMKYFPNFRLEKLDDGRLYWVGNLNPNGKSGATWTIMAVYDHNHPHNNTYGGSVKVYSIKPDLNELYTAVGVLPHILRDSNGFLYMCTARPEDVLVGKVSTSAATHIGHAAKWIKLVEDWLEGIIGDEIFQETY